MDGLVFYIFFNSIQSVVIGLRKVDYERLSAMKCCLVCKEFRLQCDSNLGICDPKMGVLTARPCGSLSY